MRPKELLNAHRYAEAVEAYKKEIYNQPEKNFHLGIGEAFMALGEFNDALINFKRNNEIESSRVKGSCPSLTKIGATFWLLGKRREAITEWHRAAAGILDGSIQYGDLAGGGTQGLLLWYGAVALKDGLERDYALKYLLKISEKKAYAICWPRPVVLMVLEEKSLGDTLNIGSGSPVISECLKGAATDLLKRRRLCQTLFYAACMERQAGNEPECIRKMKLCAQLENPILESEWYLARNESSSPQ